MGKTIAEKIFSAKAGMDLAAGDLTVVPIDFVMSQDPKSPPAIVALQKAGLPVRMERSRVILTIDHRVPCTAELHANGHASMRRFAEEEGIQLYDTGSGVGHILVPEQGHIAPGQLAVATDAHATTYGAMNVYSVSVGATELAGILATGKQWFKVPKSMRVELTGKLPKGVYAKDIILQVIARVGSSGANSHAVEYAGEAVSSLSMESRFVLSNMTADMGGETGIMEIDDTTRQWLNGRTKVAWQPVSADPDAAYARRLELDVSKLVPSVAVPHSVDKVVPVAEVAGTRIQQASVGTCTGGWLEDLRVAAAVIRGKKVANGVRFFVVPGSRQVYQQAKAEGLMDVFFEAGAILMPPCCAGCSMEDRQGVPGDGEAVISAGNRNPKGRLVNDNAFVYLASPATVAASAIEGVISDPRQYL